MYLDYIVIILLILCIIHYSVTVTPYSVIERKPVEYCSEIFKKYNSAPSY